MPELSNRANPGFASLMLGPELSNSKVNIITSTCEVMSCDSLLTDILTTDIKKTDSLTTDF